MLRSSLARCASLARGTRAYATKSKTTNLKTPPQVPVVETRLPDGSIFVARQSPVPLQRQATAPPLRQPYDKQYNLTEAQLAEMRQLRQQDPATWTRKKLAEKFNCSELFVGIAAPLPKQTLQANVEETSEYGYRKQLIKKNRQRRRELW